MDKCPKVGDRVRTPRPGEPVSAPGLPGRLEHDPKWPTEVLVDRIGVAEVFDAHRRFEAEALAAELVRRWNQHAALIEALDAVLSYGNQHTPNCTLSALLLQDHACRCHMAKANALLASLSPEERRG